MTGYRTRWVRLPEQAEDPERIAIREALAFGKAVYTRRRPACGSALPHDAAGPASVPGAHAANGAAGVRRDACE
jgi:hypothetical protein